MDIFFKYKLSFLLHILVAELTGVFLFRADDFVPKFFFQFRAEKISARNWNQITKFQFRAEKKII